MKTGHSHFSPILRKLLEGLAAASSCRARRRRFKSARSLAALRCNAGRSGKVQRKKKEIAGEKRKNKFSKD